MVTQYQFPSVGALRVRRAFRMNRRAAAPRGEGGISRMRLSYIGAALVTAALLGGRASAAPAAVTGDYVESRSANVYVGACHHEGELMTAGRNALLAWNISGGEYNGVSLKGVTAVAVV